MLYNIVLLLKYYILFHQIGTMEESCIQVDIYNVWTTEHCNLPKLGTDTIRLRTPVITVFSRNIMAGLENRSLDITSSNQVSKINLVTQCQIQDNVSTTVNKVDGLLCLILGQH